MLFRYKNLLWLAALFICTASQAVAQLGGKQSFSFLNLAYGAKQVALGGVQVSSPNADPFLFMNNPGIRQADNHQYLAVSIGGLSNGSTVSAAAFHWQHKNQGHLAAGVQYIGYGTMDGYDPAGAPTGSFSAADYALVLSYAHTLAPFTMGTSIKLAGSGIGQYQSGAVLLDFGGSFVHPEQDLSLGLSVRNLGAAFSNYTDATTFAMPFDIQVGASYKPERMPARISLSAQQLFPNGGSIVYNDPDLSQTIDENGQIVVNEPGLAEKIARRLVIGTELILHPNFNLLVGYNFLHRRELSLAQRRALTGFSMGVLLRIKGFDFAYGYSIRHIAGGHSQFSLSFNTRQKFKKKTVVE